MASEWSHPNHQQAIQELGSFLAHFHSPCCFNWAHFLPCHYVPHCTQFTQRGSLALPVIRLTCEVLTIYKTVSLTVACAVGVEPNLIAISCHTVLSHPAGLPSGNKEAREGTARFLLRHRSERSHFNIFEHCVRCYARVEHRVLSASCVVSMQRRI